jgi:hypothetical protein
MSLAARTSNRTRNTTAGAMLRKRVAMTVNPAAAGPGWAALSEHLTELAEARSPRSDLNVLVAPRATAFSVAERDKVDKEGKPVKPVPGYYMPAAARIALDGDLLPAAPDKLRPDVDPEHFRALAALQGVFVHELGHAVHTDSMDPARAARGTQAQVTLLEEIRMEARAVEDRPADAKWLRAAATQLIVEERDDSKEMTEGGAAHLAVLTEGRVAAGSLKVDDVLGVSAALEEIFEEDVLAQLRAIMEETTMVDDGDNDSMIALAQRLADLIPTPEGEPGSGGGEGMGGGAVSETAAEKLRKAVADAAEAASEESAKEIESGVEGDEVEDMAEAAASAAAEAEATPGGETGGAGGSAGPVGGGAARGSVANA